MQRFILEITMAEDEFKIYTFIVNESEICIHKCRGEEEYLLKASKLENYWEYIVNTCLEDDKDISVLMLTDKEECKGFLSSLVSVIKDSNVKNVSTEKNIWKINEVKQFILNSSKLISFTIKGIDEKNKVIFSDNQIDKKLYFDSIEDLVFDTGKVSISPSSPKKNTPSQPEGEFKRPVGPFVIPDKDTPKCSRQPKLLEQAPKDSTVTLSPCTGDDVVFYFQERSRDYCETTIYEED